MKTNRLVEGWKQWFTVPPKGPFIVTSIFSDGSFQYLTIGPISVNGKSYRFKIKMEYKLLMKTEKIGLEDTKGNKIIEEIPNHYKYSATILKYKFMVLRARIPLDKKKEGPIWKRDLFETS